MKPAQWIKNFLIEEAMMDSSTAFKLLGLEHGDYDGVDKAFKKMAMKHHPDRGGDVETMKQINQAKDSLEGGSGSGSAFGFHPNGRKKESEADIRERNVRRVAKAKVVTDYIYNKLNSLVQEFEPLLMKHLEKHTGKKFSVDSKAQKADNTYDGEAHWSTGSINKWNGHVDWKIKFTSEDGQSIFFIELTGHIGERDFEHALSADDLEMEVSFETFAYSEGKKTKMQVKNWGNKAKAASLGKPEDFFPAKKLTKSVTTAKTRPTRRADAYAFLKTEMKAIFPYTDKDLCLIPIDNDEFVQMQRQTRNGISNWSFNKIVKKDGTFNYKIVTTSAEAVKIKMKIFMEALPDFAAVVREGIKLLSKRDFDGLIQLLDTKEKEYKENIEPNLKKK